MDPKSGNAKANRNKKNQGAGRGISRAQNPLFYMCIYIYIIHESNSVIIKTNRHRE